MQVHFQELSVQAYVLHKHDILGMEEKQVHSQLTLLHLVISKRNVTAHFAPLLYIWFSSVTISTELNFYWNKHMIYTWMHVYVTAIQ